MFSGYVLDSVVSKLKDHFIDRGYASLFSSVDFNNQDLWKSDDLNEDVASWHFNSGIVNIPSAGKWLELVFDVYLDDELTPEIDITDFRVNDIN